MTWIPVSEFVFIVKEIRGLAWLKYLKNVQKKEPL